jgi:hypothetical protein
VGRREPLADGADLDLPMDRCHVRHGAATTGSAGSSIEHRSSVRIERGQVASSITASRDASSRSRRRRRPDATACASGPPQAGCQRTRQRSGSFVMWERHRIDLRLLEGLQHLPQRRRPEVDMSPPATGRSRPAGKAVCRPASGHPLRSRRSRCPHPGSRATSTGCQHGDPSSHASASRCGWCSGCPVGARGVCRAGGERQRDPLTRAAPSRRSRRSLTEPALCEMTVRDRDRRARSLHDRVVLDVQLEAHNPPQ